jgi:hypothetical protein
MKVSVTLDGHTARQPKIQRRFYTQEKAHEMNEAFLSTMNFHFLASNHFIIHVLPIRLVTLKYCSQNVIPLAEKEHKLADKLWFSIEIKWIGCILGRAGSVVLMEEYVYRTVFPFPSFNSCPLFILSLHYCLPIDGGKEEGKMKECCWCYY